MFCSMSIDELKIGLRVRVPAFEKPEVRGEKTYHYAYVRDIATSLFGDGDTVLIQIPALKMDKAVHPSTLTYARKPTKKRVSAD